MALSLARCLLDQGGFVAERVRKAYADWCASNPFDIGTTTSSAFAFGHLNHQSQANGSLMRCSPLALAGWSRPEQLAEWAAADSEMSHPHPRCREACQVYTRALAAALGGGEREEVWESARAVCTDLTGPLLDEARSRPPEDYMTQMGWVSTPCKTPFINCSTPTAPSRVSWIRFAAEATRIPTAALPAHFWGPCGGARLCQPNGSEPFCRAGRPENSPPAADPAQLASGPPTHWWWRSAWVGWVRSHEGFVGFPLACHVPSRGRASHFSADSAVLKRRRSECATGPGDSGPGCRGYLSTGPRHAAIQCQCRLVSSRAIHTPPRGASPTLSFEPSTFDGHLFHGMPRRPASWTQCLLAQPFPRRKLHATLESAVR